MLAPSRNHKIINLFMLCCSLFFNGDKTSAQNWSPDGNNAYTFNSTSSNTFTGTNSLQITNSATGILSVDATVSSADNTTAIGTTQNSNASMFSVFGYGVSGTNGANGPNFQFSSSASASYSLSGSSYVAGLPANPEANAGPTYTTGPGSIFNVISNGASPNNNLTTTNLPINGSNGGSVGVSTSSSQTINLLLLGPAANSGSSISSNNSNLPWQPSAATINAASIGGTPIAQQPPQTLPDNAVIGNGGAGGSITVNVNQPTTIEIGNSQNPVNGSVAGISALSKGNSGAVCCYQIPSGSGADAGKNWSYQAQLSSDWQNMSTQLQTGQNGNGGNVSVTNNGNINASQNLLPSGQYGGNITGISASSIGGAIQINPKYEFYNPPPLASTPGVGGEVTVLNTGAINLPGQNSIGILAASSADQTILPTPMQVSGSTNASGTIQITNDGNITTGNNQNGASTVSLGTISGGIVAISSTGWLVNPFNSGKNSNMSSGNGGNVTVNNQGNISSYGHAAIGIGSLSIGNSGLITGNSGNGVNYLGSGISGNGYDAAAGTSTVTNEGSIVTLGSTAIGILAAANGSGGLLANDVNPVFQGSYTNPYGIEIGELDSGVALGSNVAAYASNGGAVNVTNKASGSIQTGYVYENGQGSTGIVAQSIGGGGGSVVGRGAAAQVGDSGGSGGSGGAVTTSNYGLVTTYNDGSAGILAQSVGGGGGNGANSSGLFASVGGSGGNGGSGGSVSVSNGPSQTPNSYGQIYTAGDYSAGVIAQSVGGGGGNGGYSKSFGAFVSAGIGGSGGDGGNGGSVSFTNGYTGAVYETYGSQPDVNTNGDQSPAVMLQSIGGGGGTGGAASSYTAGIIFASSVALGGTGGTGGNGGDIGTSIAPAANYGGNVTNPGGLLVNMLATNGNDSIAFLAQSVGGGGGNGGGTIAKTLATSLPDAPSIPTLSFANSIGGGGSTGGTGGQINLLNTGSIATKGSNSGAIVAQSVGGGGGNGGDSSAGANAYGLSDYTINVSTSIGGSSSVAGNGGVVSVNNTTSESTAGTYYTVTTQGNNSAAILAQSIGGGGGSGGTGNSTQTSGTSGAKSLNAATGVGGQGGAGGNAGDVSVTNSLSTRTNGSASSGVVAQSIGGGGGVGYSAGTQGISGGYTANIAIGGNGGSGGSSGNVTVTNNSTIKTGDSVTNTGSNNVAIGGDSHGVVAQSISGGGGIGGSTDPVANLISQPTSVIANGVNAYLTAAGVYEYLSTSGTPLPKNYQATIAVGGNGGTGGAAGTLTTINNGDISTIGHRSFGILAQSIGGGGGVGGSVMSGSSAVDSSLSGGVGISALSGLTFNSAVNVGGSGGKASQGGIVSITQTGNITTSGYGSYGVLAQSIGGGGGYGADGSIAANKWFTGSASWNDGVSGGLSISLGANNSAPSIGSGGAVNYGTSSGFNSGNIITNGDHSVAILAQSIGGGGGIGSAGCSNNGLSSSASACLANTSQISGTQTPQSFIVNGQAISLAINPTGTVSNSPSNGGAVNVYSGENITTYGNGSIGLMAQSIGGAGGLILANSQNISSAVLPVMGSFAGTGGKITIQENGSITTSGAGSWGIFAQSVGGGGGFLGDPNFSFTSQILINLYNNVTANLGGAAAGGNIDVTLNGSILTTGQNAHGIVAQSIGGGGGLACFNGACSTSNPKSSQNEGSGTIAGSGGSVSIQVENSGNITALGSGSIGILALSQGNSSSNSSSGSTASPITITVNGNVTATTGIVVAGGNFPLYYNLPNTITINSGGSVQAPAGNNAIAAYYGNTNVINNGTVSGGISIGETFIFPGLGGEFTNNGTYNATGTVVTSNNSFKNYGLLYVSGNEVVGTTNVFGSYKQYSSGVTVFDINTSQGINDKLNIIANNISSGTMLPGGIFLINRLDSGLLPSASTTLKLVSAGGGFLDEADGVKASQIKTKDNSPLVNWTLSANGGDLSISPSINPYPSGIFFNKNQQSFLNYIAAGYNSGAFGFDNAVGRLVSNGASANLPGAVDSLNGANGAAHTIQQQAIVMTSNSMLGSALSCSSANQNGQAFDKSECAWANINGSQLNQASLTRNPGFKINYNTYATGGQGRLAPDTYVGGAMRFGKVNAFSKSLTASASVFDASLGVKKILGSYYIGLSGGFGISSQSNNRYSTDFLTGQSYNQSSMSNLYYGGLKLRNAYQFDGPLNSYIKPYLDLDTLWTHTPTYQETGFITTVPLRYNSTNKFNFIASPMIEAGGTLNIGVNKNSWLKPFVSAGMMYISNNNNHQSASLAGTNFGSYEIFSNSPNTLFRGNAGVQLFSNDNLDLRFEYNSLVGEGFLAQGGSARLNGRF